MSIDSPTNPASTRRTIAPVQHLEFLIEPFEEGRPGPHVTAAVAAAERAGGRIDFGALSSTCVAPADRIPGIVAALLTAAFANGATGVRLSVDQIDGAGTAGEATT